jgi:RHS repeat-associated protein
MSYGGCGCAGGEVTTITDEAGRQRRLTKDVLGRLHQVEELNWDGSVYATSVYEYNGRDQLTSINQAGQARTMEYDGMGRLWHRTTPEQGLTTYSYNLDDTVNTVEDARTAVTQYRYNNRGLVTAIEYPNAGSLGLGWSPWVTYQYDAAGNRTVMTDGEGTVNYSYDQLSRLTSETRTFTYIGGASHSRTLSYAYNLAGELTSITAPSANGSTTTTGYTRDYTGQVTAVTGSNGISVPNYVSSISYRAWGATKQMNYGNGRALGILYDNRLRPWQWNVDGVLGTQYYYGYFGKDGQGENTGRVTYAHDYYDYRGDRSYEYDQVGRLIKSETGDDARIHIGESVSGLGGGSYHQQNSFDVWGNLTSRSGDGGWLPNYNMNYVNNQMQVGRTYDAAGNFVDDGWGQHFQYDAASRQVSDGVHVGQAFDGDGLRARKADYGVTTFYLRSSVLGGQVVSEFDANGNWQRGYVSGGSGMIAIQSNSEGIRWVHADPITKKQRLTDSAGVTQSIIDVDPWGAETAWQWNQSSQSHRYTSYERDGNGGDDAQARHYQAVWSRFDQPDPSDGSYDLTNPQSFNRYSYTQNDPVNFVDPSGLNLEAYSSCNGGQGIWIPDEQHKGQFNCVNTVSAGSISPGPDPFASIFNNPIFLFGSITPIPMQPIDTGGGGGGDPQNSALSDSVNRQIQRSLTYDKCAKLLGGADKALQALANIKITFEDLGQYENVGGTPRGPHAGIDAGTDPGTNEIKINTQGGYSSGGYATANDGKIVYVGGGLSNDAYRASVILHELVHLINPKAFGKNNLDGNDFKRSAKNQAKVVKACL